MKSRSSAAALLLALAGCSSVGVEGVDFGGPPHARRLFPSQTIEGIVFAQARYADHVADFGEDLVAEIGVVPIRLTVQLRGRGAEVAQIMLSPARMGLRLVLPDGAVLDSVRSDDVARMVDEELAAVVRKEAFQGGLLQATPSEGYVFFALKPPTEFAMEGRVVRHAERGLVRKLDLADSLLSFNASLGDDSTQTTFYVGIAR